MEKRNLQGYWYRKYNKKINKNKVQEMHGLQIRTNRKKKLITNH